MGTDDQSKKGVKLIMTMKKMMVVMGWLDEEVIRRIEEGEGEH